MQRAGVAPLPLKILKAIDLFLNPNPGPEIQQRRLSFHPHYNVRGKTAAMHYGQLKSCPLAHPRARFKIVKQT